ncbi:MAG TPA: hypothetical protein VF116_19230 [Ktedonobacterales bacterium]
MAVRGDGENGEDKGDESDEQHTWPEALLPAQAAREWIATSLPGNPPVVGPLIVHQAKEWGATASFATLDAQTTASGAHSGREVILKLSTLPLFAAAPRLAALLHAAAPDAMPEVIAWDQRDGLSLTLFQPFEGRPVSEVHALAPLLETARTLARIQVAMAALPPDETASLLRTPVAQIPRLFDTVLRDVYERQMAYWAGTDTGRAIARQFALPPDLPARLEAVRPHIAAWAAELASGPWPETVDHVDLHGENAVLRTAADGSILIFDWEEAVLSAPFFSLDRLLNDARELDLGERAAWSPDSAPDAALYTPSEVALRDAYLAALPWGTPAARERAFALAMALAPIKAAYEGIELGEALGWDAADSSFGTAWALARALPRWQALMSSETG